MKLKFLTYTFFVLFLIPPTIFSNPHDEWFKTANSFYEKKEYDSCVTSLEKILNAGIKNSKVYYNLGNAYFRLNKLGLAILHYEKAKRLSPTDPDIIANLRFAQLNIADRIPEPERTFVESLLLKFHDFLSLNTQMWILLILLFILSIFFVFGLFSSHNIRLWLIYISSICLFMSCLLSFSIGKKIYDLEKKKFAILLEKTVDVKNEPEGSKILFTVHEGIKFQIQKTKEDWSLVSLPNGVSGWVKNSSLGNI